MATSDEAKKRKMYNRNGMEGVRDILWDTIEKVQDRKISTEDAAIVLKATENIIHTYKVELAHAAIFKKPVKGLPDAGKTLEIGGGTEGEVSGEPKGLPEPKQGEEGGAEAGVEGQEPRGDEGAGAAEN